MSGSPCCPPGSWGAPQDTGYTHKGKFEAISDVDCYVTGTSSQAKAVIFSFSDVFPCLLERKREVADQLAAAIPDSYVVMPDYWRGMPVMEIPSLSPTAGRFRAAMAMLRQVPRTLYRIRFMHTWQSLSELLEPLVRELRLRHPNAHFLCYGYCFGAYVVCKCSSYLGFSAGVSFHPSPQVCRMQPRGYRQTLEELASAVRCPVLLLPAGNDPDNLKEGGEFVNWLPSGSGSHTYPDMKHGYMSRAAFDTTPLANLMGGDADSIATAQADALQRTIAHFKEALKKPPVAEGPAPAAIESSSCCSVL